MTNRLPDIDDYLTWLERAPEAVKHAFDGIAIYDLAGRVVYGNASARTLIGAQYAGLFIGQPFTAHLTIEAAEKAAADFNSCVMLGTPIDSDTTFRDVEGQPVPVRIRLVPAIIESTIVGVIGFARDARGRQSAEAQFMRSEQQFRSLFENHPDALALHDLDGRYTRANVANDRLTGYTGAELLGQTPALMAPAPDGWADGERIRETIARGETVEFEHTIVTKDGSLREVNGRAVPLHIDGRVRGWCSMVRDVTDERRVARASARQATRIAELYRIAANASVPTDEKITMALEAGMIELGSAWGCIVRTVEGASEIVASIGKTVPKTLTGVAPESYASVPLSVEGKTSGALAFALRETAGKRDALSAPDRDYVSALATLIGSAIQQNDREKHLDSLAFGDSLTGLPNRALLQDRLEQTLLSARRHRRSFAAHFIDIDHFKEINDTYGHHAGDGVLVAVAAWMRQRLRDSDTIGRFGGDEFVVLQPEIDSQKQAEELAAKLCAIRDHPFTVGDRQIVVTISVGCAVFPVDAENPIDMLRAADAALYEVKHRGRDGYAVGQL